MTQTPETVNERLDASSPPGVTDPGALQSVTALAGQVARADIPQRRITRRAGWVIALTSALVLGGATGALATPGLVPWSPFAPQVSFDGEFPVVVPGGATNCHLTVRAVADYLIAGPDAEVHLAEAQEFLETYDWSTLDNPDSDYAKARAALIAEGETKPFRYIAALSDQISQIAIENGAMRSGVSLEGNYGCDSDSVE